MCVRRETLVYSNPKHTPVVYTWQVTVAKEPGITAEQVRKPAVMDMTYSTQFQRAYVGDAYERMFLNAARGDQALFVSAAELVEAW